uniref:Uncharacterized protein n=1 Tax=Spongospora subterranea TaxID=70186 RepID=A0A0H5R0Y7_9EUKA|eukprot:CRZ01454.1 hypothetical protein [Spongospora subterranea]
MNSFGSEDICMSRPIHRVQRNGPLERCSGLVQLAMFNKVPIASREIFLSQPHRSTSTRPPSRSLQIGCRVYLSNCLNDLSTIHSLRFDIALAHTGQLGNGPHHSRTLQPPSITVHTVFIPWMALLSANASIVTAENSFRP